MSLNDLHNKIKEDLKIIECEEYDGSITYGDPNREGLYVERLGEKYIFGHYERGSKDIIIKTENFYDVEYEILSTLLFSISYSKYLKNNYYKTKNRDQRRFTFAKQLELMKKINEEYYEKLKKHIDKILEDFPYNDSFSIREDCTLDYDRILRKLYRKYLFKINKFNIKHYIDNTLKKIPKDINVAIQESLFKEITSGMNIILEELKNIDFNDIKVITELEDLLEIANNYLKEQSIK